MNPVVIRRGGFQVKERMTGEVVVQQYLQQLDARVGWNSGVMMCGVRSTRDPTRMIMRTRNLMERDGSWVAH